MYLSFRMSGFHDELSKIAGAGKAVGHFVAGMLSPAFDVAHHAVSAAHPGHLHIGSRAGHFGALAGTAGIVGGAYHLGKKKGMQKQSEGFGGPNTTDGDEMAKMGGFLKNTLLGVGMMGATAGGAHAVKAMAKPVAQIAKAPRMIGAASSQMADLAREGVKFASRLSSG